MHHIARFATWAAEELVARLISPLESDTVQPTTQFPGGRSNMRVFFSLVLNRKTFSQMLEPHVVLEDAPCGRLDPSSYTTKSYVRGASLSVQSGAEILNQLKAGPELGLTLHWPPVGGFVFGVTTIADDVADAVAPFASVTSQSTSQLPLGRRKLFTFVALAL